MSEKKKKLLTGRKEERNETRDELYIRCVIAPVDPAFYGCDTRLSKVRGEETQHESAMPPRND